jgi:hypothetical protein
MESSGRLLIAVLLAAAAGGCSRDPRERETTGVPHRAMGRAVAAQGAAVGLSAARADPCSLVTSDDVRRISGYGDAVVRPPASRTSCTRRTPDDRFGIVVTLGPYVDLRASLGGTHVTLDRGLQGLHSASGWLTTIIYPDGTSASLVIGGTALDSHDSAAVTLADGRVADAAAQYRAYAEAMVANSR